MRFAREMKKNWVVARKEEGVNEREKVLARFAWLNWVTCCNNIWKKQIGRFNKAGIS